MVQMALLHGRENGMGASHVIGDPHGLARRVVSVLGTMAVAVAVAVVDALDGARWGVEWSR